MKIWIINHYAGNFEYGMEYRHFLLSRHLVKFGFEPVIICASYHHLYTSPPEVEEEIKFEKHDGIDFAIVKTKTYSGNGFGRLMNTMQFSLRLNHLVPEIVDRFGKPDVVFGSSPHPFVGLNLYSIKRKFQIPSLFEVRDLWPLMLIELGSLSRYHPLTLIFSVLEKLAFRDNDRIVSLWHSADAYILKQGVTKEKYVYIPNGIEKNSVVGGIPESERALLGLVESRKEKGKFLIGYGGSHGLANPLDMMIEACRELEKEGNDTIEFFLVGDGPKKAETVARAKELGLENVHFYDYVSKPTIMAFYSLIDVAFMGLKNLPLFKYGPTPNKLMDYLSAGKPIIYSIDSSFNPVEQAGAGFSVPSNDHVGLAQAAIKMSKLEPNELESMGNNGQRYAEEELSFESLAKRLVDTVHEVANSG